MGITATDAPAGRTGDTHRSAARQVLHARRVSELTALLDARPDLVGTHERADFAADAVRWSA